MVENRTAEGAKVGKTACMRAPQVWDGLGVVGSTAGDFSSPARRPAKRCDVGAGRTLLRANLQHSHEVG